MSGNVPKRVASQGPELDSFGDSIAPPWQKYAAKYPLVCPSQNKDKSEANIELEKALPFLHDAENACKSITPQAAKSSLFCPAQEKIRTVVSKGARNISHTLPNPPMRFHL